MRNKSKLPAIVDIHWGCSIFPRNSIVPSALSDMQNKNGRLTFISNGRLDETMQALKPTAAVAAAAFVPFSSKSTTDDDDVNKQTPFFFFNTVYFITHQPCAARLTGKGPFQCAGRSHGLQMQTSFPFPRVPSSCYALHIPPWYEASRAFLLPHVVHTWTVRRCQLLHVNESWILYAL